MNLRRSCRKSIGPGELAVDHLDHFAMNFEFVLHIGLIGPIFLLPRFGV